MVGCQRALIEATDTMLHRSFSPHAHTQTGYFLERKGLSVGQWAVLRRADLVFLEGLDDKARVETELFDKLVDDLLLLVVELLYQL